MDRFVLTKTYPEPPVDKREILRYAGVKGESADTSALLEDCLLEIGERLNYRVCYCEFQIERRDNEINLGFAKTDSRLLAKNLENCHKIILFCATVGVEMDRLISRYSSISPARSVMLQAIGSERVEALCDEFCRDVTENLGEGFSSRPRFSPGYGDLPLELQREIFLALEPSKRIGVTLGDNLFMSPSKSVTAIIGIKNDN